MWTRMHTPQAMCFCLFLCVCVRACVRTPGKEARVWPGNLRSEKLTRALSPDSPLPESLPHILTKAQPRLSDQDSHETDLYA